MIKRILFAMIAVLLLASCRDVNIKDKSRQYNIIPLPNEIVSKSGVFILEGDVGVSFQDDSITNGVFEYLSEMMQKTSIMLSKKTEGENAPIEFVIDNSLKDEAYILDITSDRISIKSNYSGAGLFYGVQSLIQLFPSEIYTFSESKVERIEIPNVYINDSPRFPYRGAMMDVARNFLPKETVFKFIDMMALYKINHLHLHLTNDQGWRIEIKKYPKLIEVGSHRKQTQIGHSDYYFPRRYDGIEHGGYYTQDEIREIVAYAAKNFITVVPEIEMPGHASAALASYPELSCGLEDEYVVRDYFDIFDEVFCPKENTFAFLEDVLSEVIELFPSHYIHIGGDECPKKAWKRCPHCQSLMKREGLQDEDELQSWFIHRIEEFVNSKGRDIIGWDEILEGGLAPNATVMSWRGEIGGITAARQKHRVIMSPGYRCYFDFYQEDPEFAPLAMSGFLPLDSVYDYDPLPAELTTEEQKYIIGAQANIWGEYIQTTDYFEYMTFPRLLAISEVQWTEPKHKDFNDFTVRLANEFKRLDYYDINSSRNFYEVNFFAEWNNVKDKYEVELKTFVPNSQIHYSINDSVVTNNSPLYSESLLLDSDATIYARVYVDGASVGRTTQKSFAVNYATGKKYTSVPEPESVNSNGNYGLTDGIRAYATTMHRWVSFRQDAIEIVVDLEGLRSVSDVGFASLWRPWNYTWPAKAIKVYASSDGSNYTQIADKEFEYDFSPTEAVRFPVLVSFPDVDAKYIKLEIESWGECSAGYYRAGEQSKLAIDEIEIH